MESFATLADLQLRGEDELPEKRYLVCPATLRAVMCTYYVRVRLQAKPMGDTTAHLENPRHSERHRHVYFRSIYFQGPTPFGSPFFNGPMAIIAAAMVQTYVHLHVCLPQKIKRSSVKFFSSV